MIFNKPRTFTFTRSFQESKVFLCDDFNCSYEWEKDESQKRLFETVYELDLVVDLW